MKNSKRRGFTIVELVVVVAVIAILAAILIPTFSNLISRSNVSADTQLCRNLNTILTTAESEGRIPGSMYDVLYLLNEGGYRLENLQAKSAGRSFAWDSKGNRILYLNEDLTKVIYPEDYEFDPFYCYITVDDAQEAKRVAEAGYSIYLAALIDTLELNNVAVNIDTGEFRINSLTMNGSVSENVTVHLMGNFGTTVLNASNVSYRTTGNVASLTFGSAVNGSMSINSSVTSFINQSINSATLSGTGFIHNVNLGSVTNSSGTTINVEEGGSSVKLEGSTGSVPVSTKEDIQNIRIQIAGGRRFEGETIELAGDINMNGIAFQPISNFSREPSSQKDSYFAGNFDGKGHTISNFSTSGFSISGLNAGTNKSSVDFGNITYREAVYGLFGSIYVNGEASIKNLTITCAIDMVINDANQYVGDSVGGLIGYVYGKGVLNVENVTIKGYINGFDGVAGFIGRAYADKTLPEPGLTINFINCNNYANVTGVRKTGGFIGSGNSSNGLTVEFDSCFNYGDITCLGKEYEKNNLNGPGGGDGYYKAGPGSFEQTTAHEGLTNTGKIIIAGVEQNN